jgi:hypothetical protein
VAEHEEVGKENHPGGVGVGKMNRALVREGHTGKIDSVSLTTDGHLWPLKLIASGPIRDIRGKALSFGWVF